MKKLILATVCAAALTAFGSSVASAQMSGPTGQRMERMDSNARMMHRHHMKRHKMHQRHMMRKRQMGM